MEFYVKEYNNNDNHGIIKLIKAQKNLNYFSLKYEKVDNSLCKTNMRVQLFYALVTEAKMTVVVIDKFIQ